MRRGPLLLAALLIATVLAGCGGGEQDVALAIGSARRVGEQVLVTTECADDLRVEVRPDPEGSGLAQVTIWGSPRVGRCHPVRPVEGIASDQGKLVDGATSQVVAITSP